MTNTRNYIASLMTAEWLAALWPTIIRIVLGVLMIYHGGRKLFGEFDNVVADIAEIGWPLPYIQAFATVFIEFAGGILLVVGLFTRPVAFASVVLFNIITFLYLYVNPFPAKEKALLYLILSVYVFFMGPGKFSVDHFLFKKTAEQKQA
ncbi:MAG: DoxX family protein [Ignavibacteria bacterium]|nr:DoxX family protein [Ignavibacteria bacterium]